MKRVGLGLGLLVCSTFALAADRYPYQSCFEVAATMHGVPLDLLLAVAATESNWDAGARSHANAHGIMQIQWPGTARHLGVKRVAELYNPCLNISLGAKYLAQLSDEFQSAEAALAAYNYGPTRIKAAAELPAGARRYAATVIAHRERIADGLVPEELRGNSSKTLVSFSSKARASRVARTLTEDLDGATVLVQRRSRLLGGYAVVLAVGSGGLTVGDHAVLRNMGFTP